LMREGVVHGSSGYNEAAQQSAVITLVSSAEERPRRTD